MKVVGLAYLFEPLPFLRDRIELLNASMLRDVMIYWVDCSSVKVFDQVRGLIEEECRFGFRLEHLPEGTARRSAWNHVVAKTRECTEYYSPIHVRDVHHPLYFLKMTSLLDERPEWMAAACSQDGTTTRAGAWPASTDAFPVDSGSAAGHLPMWRSAVHDAVGLFDESRTDPRDADFWAKVRALFGAGSVGTHPERLGCRVPVSAEKNSVGGRGATRSGRMGPPGDVVRLECPAWSLPVWELSGNLQNVKEDQDEGSECKR